ncbi:MAG TPA: dienelactone hydrolase family protein [Jiangellaceae bacterium]|nr:dienelactone hydrolase family protein [Jiangellaceae bacterium]
MAIDAELAIPADEHSLPATLTVPDASRGVVVFAHGSGSSRHSPRNIHVAKVMHRAGLGTLLFDLLTPDEERVDALDAHLRFDIGLLSRRLDAAVRTVAGDPRVAASPIGLFGASTGAAAALATAARLPDVVRAVVSRGGRPDLAGSALGEVRAAVLLIVGSLDQTVLELNRDAARLLRGEHELAVVPGATHLFPEPGALDEVARLATAWFLRALVPP